MSSKWRVAVAAASILASITVVSRSAAAQEVHTRVGPDRILPGEGVRVYVDFTDFDPASTFTATADASALGGPASVPLAAAGTTLSASFATTAAAGTYAIPITWTATNPPTSGSASASVVVIERARCIPTGHGVPYFNGPPKWRDWPGDPREAIERPDDPRWNGATAGGGVWNSGGANEPVNFRALRSAGFLYLQWQVNVSASNQTRTLYVGFRTHGRSYIVRFHLAPPAAVPPSGVLITDPAFCAGSLASCDCPGCPGTPTLQTHYKVFEETPFTQACGGNPDLTVHPQYAPGGVVGPVPWIGESARYFAVGANDWVLQLRVPIGTGITSFSEGVDERFALWFEAVPAVATSIATYAWPEPMRASGLQTCEQAPTSPTPRLWHAGLGTSANLAPVRLLSSVGESRCSLGVRLRSVEVGAVRGTPDYDTVSLTNAFVAPHSGDPPVENHVIARPENRTSVAIPAASLRAKFRLADWGVQASVQNQWSEIPGAGAVPLAGGIPAATGGTPGRGRFQFTWTLDSSYLATYNPALNRHHQCMLVEMQVVGQNAAGEHIDLENASVYRNMNFGNMSVFPQPAVVDVRGLPTYPGQTHHEIYLVAVPRNLPKSVAPGTDGLGFFRAQAQARAQDLAAPYLHALEQDPDRQPGEIPYDEGNREPLDQSWRTPLADDALLPAGGDRLRQHAKLGRFAAMMPADLRAIFAALDGATKAEAPKRRDGVGPAQALTAELGEALDPATLSRVVPTLEVYALYKTGDQAGEGRAVLRPMTSFVFYLSHDGPLAGMRWLIDGAEAVDPSDPDNNVFRVRIPIDKPGRQIRLRVQGLEPGEEAIRPDLHYPCARTGGCCPRPCSSTYQIGNAFLGALALAWATRRRRRRDREAR
jgi:MYXO-CTERM domain-containing protein